MSRTHVWLPILAGLLCCLGCAEDGGMEANRTASLPPDAQPKDASQDPAVQETPDGTGTGPVETLPTTRPKGRPPKRVDTPRTLPFAAADPQSKFASVRVFYGTDRAPTGSGEPSKFYGRERGDLSLGFCDVSIPRNHRTGELESPKIWKFEFRENPEKHVVLLNVESVSGSTFLAKLRRTIKDSIEIAESDGTRREVGGEAFVFVHGYNVTFEDAARRTAQIAYDLDFRGAPVMYSWPSQGKGTLNAYKEDSRTAEWCEENMMQFVAGLARQSGARKLHLIAHSMGNRIVASALRRLAQDRPAGEIPSFNEIILTAPDIDAQTFKVSIAPRIVQAAERITIYASANDVALKASSLVNTLGDPRLGQGGTSLTTFPNYRQIDVVDASNVDTSLFAFQHSYHADSTTVLSDIRKVLNGVPADSRGLSAIVNQAAWRLTTGRKRVGGVFNRLRR